MSPLPIGSRGSQLALWQANHIAALLRDRGHEVELEIIKTAGDKITDVALAKAVLEDIAGTVVRGYRALVAKHKGEVSAEVTLAEQPSETHLAAIKDALAAATKKNVQVQVKVDPSLIGGLVVKVGSRMVDSSLRTKLNAIKVAMQEAH